MCLTLLQELKGRLYLKIILILTVLIALFCLILFYLFFFQYINIKTCDLATYIFTTWPLQLYVYIVYKTKLL